MVGETQGRCCAWHRWGHGGGSWGLMSMGTHIHAHGGYMHIWEKSRHNPMGIRDWVDPKDKFICTICMGPSDTKYCI